MDKVNEFEYGADIHYSNDVNTNYVKFSVDSNLHYRFSSAEDLLNDLDTLAAMIKHH
ncbi:phage portal protein, partial [Enterococcus faecium]